MWWREPYYFPKIQTSEKMTFVYQIKNPRLAKCPSRKLKPRSSADLKKITSINSCIRIKETSLAQPSPPKKTDGLFGNLSASTTSMCRPSNLDNCMLYYDKFVLPLLIGTFITRHSGRSGAESRNPEKASQPGSIGFQIMILVRLRRTRRSPLGKAYS